ncbi:MAG: hypothetical protein ABIB43_06315 [archaeon]
MEIMTYKKRDFLISEDKNLQNFVKINNRILDQDKLKRESLLVKNHIIISIHDLLRPYGFEKKRIGFVNEDLNMKIKFKFDKIEKEEII